MIPFSDAVNEWSEHLEAQSLSGQSIRTYLSHMKLLEVETRGSWPTYRDLVRWQRQNAHLSQTTRHHRAKTVRRFFSWCVDQGYVPGATNPAKSMPMPKRDQLDPHTLSEEEMNELVSGKPRLPFVIRLMASYRKGERHLVKRDLLILRMLLLTGLRRAELCSLNVGDVDLKYRLIYVRKGKGGKSRTVPFPANLDLEEWVAGKRHDAPLFTGRYSGKRFGEKGVNELFKDKISMAFGRRVHPHLLRHTYATYLARRVPLPQLQDLLGHRSLATTQMYIGMTGEELKGAVSYLDGVGG